MIGDTKETTDRAAVPAIGTTVAGDRKLSTAVVEAVAETAGVEPTELDIPLYDCIDPDALDVLFAPTHEGTDRGKGRVTFEMGEYDVTVHSDGAVEVRERTTA